MSSGPLLKRLDALLERGERMSSFQFPEKEGTPYQLGEANRENLREWKDSCLEVIRASVGDESLLYRAFPVDYLDHRQGRFYAAMEHYLCIMRILREWGGERPKEESPSEALAPFIVGGAQRLLKAGYKDSVAIYCRAALEVSQRELCRRRGVGFEAGDSINKLAQKLMEATVLSLEEWRAIQTWATTANAVAYQKFKQYKSDQVEEMVSWLQEFAARTARKKPVVTADDS